MRVLRPSAQCASLISHFEGCKEKIPGTNRLRAYKDPRGIWTIGHGSIFLKVLGRPLRRIVKGDIVTQSQADAMFHEELNGFAVDVNFLTQDIPTLQQHQFDALVSFAYNLGSDIDDDDIAEGLGDSTLLKMIKRNPADPKLEAEWIKWRNKGSAWEAGLLRRRKAEFHLYAIGKLRFYF